MDGIKPKNMGSCPINRGVGCCFDGTGTFLESIELQPGDELSWYRSVLGNATRSSSAATKSVKCGHSQMRYSFHFYRNPRSGLAS